MNKYGIKPYRRARKPRKKDDEGKQPSKYKNKIRGICPIRPDVVWVSDFTYIKYKGRFIYLATVVDLYTREAIGLNMRRFHSAELVVGALTEAIAKRGRPKYLHSDQGSEYESHKHIQLAETLGIEISMSKKASPWENGHQESFFGRLKTEFGDFNRFETFGQLLEAIHKHMDYYNYKRIHTALKMSPTSFRESHYRKLGT